MNPLISIVKPVSFGLVFLLFSLPGFAGTEWGSGGGTGAICFKTASVASSRIHPEANGKVISYQSVIQNLRSILSQSGEISARSYLDNIDLVEIVDFGEADRISHIEKVHFIWPQDEESFENYTLKLIEKFKKDLPLFTNQMVDALPHIIRERDKVIHEYKMFKEWLKYIRNRDRSIKTLYRTNDENMSYSVYDSSRCLIVQIIKQQGIGERMRIQTDPSVFFHDSHSQASRTVSWLHETVYLALRTFNYKTYGGNRLKDARHVRLITQALMNQSTSAEDLKRLVRLSFPNGYRKLAD